MAVVNYTSIEKKIMDYAKSDKGQKRMDKKLISYVNKNVDKTDAGSIVLNKRRMKGLAKELIKYICDEAYSAGAPDSVLADISSLKATDPKHVGGTTWEVQLYFGNSLYRPSLEPEKYGGVTNIVALFNNGYPKDPSRSVAISYVSGFWHGEFVNAKSYRESLQFMQWAVNRFNIAYGAKYNIYVELAPVYED